MGCEKDPGDDVLGHRVERGVLHFAADQQGGSPTGLFDGKMSRESRLADMIEKSIDLKFAAFLKLRSSAPSRNGPSSYP